MTDLPFDVEPVKPAAPTVAPIIPVAIDVETGKKGKAKKEAPAIVEPINQFAVFYVAECSEPAQGYFGVGVHGYVVTDTLAKKGYGLKKYVPTAKGYKNDGKKELQIIREVVDIRAPLEKPEHTTTVANCIIHGCVLAAEYVNQMTELPKTLCLLVPRKNLSIFLTKGYITAIEAGYKDGKGNPLPFKEVLDSFLRVREALVSKGVSVSVEYVNPEDGKGLPVATSNARDAVLTSIKSRSGMAEAHCIVSPPEGYWNHDHNRHPLLGKSRMVFKMANRDVPVMDHVYLMDFDKSSKKKEHLHKLEIEVGQLLPSASYCVAKLKEVDPIIRAIVTQHTHYLDTPVERMGVLFLDAVFKPGAHSVMTKVGAEYLHSTTYVTDLVDSYGAMYTHELNPARQAHRAWNTYLDMESLVLSFLSNRDSHLEDEKSKLHVENGGCMVFSASSGIHTATNITKHFIDVMDGAKGKPVYKASKKVETPNTALLVPAFYLDTEQEDKVMEAKINLAIGIDMPKRNAIAAMANEKFEAYVLVRQDTAFTVRHFVVVTNGDEYGIWAAPFANRTFVKK